ncbi:hypothetical protein [Thioalkalivibrio sp. ALE20]|uniref:hypothetical protein n=1 Tax=Thioalkalivibrio sp. ALE20 TaxID=545275 RepID=UPI000373E4A4|nr:hypothetical protein [Thioalkalivibrio sp. ALE20]
MKIIITPEIDPENPRNWDNLGTMVCWHNRYQLGDTQPDESPDEWADSVWNRHIIQLPLYLYDHSGITISTRPFHCPWDSGQVGWIMAERDRIRQAFGWKRITRNRAQRIREILEAEVYVYDLYLRGEVYQYLALDDEGCVLDACGGFYGSGHVENGMKEHWPPGWELAEIVYADSAFEVAAAA